MIKQAVKKSIELLPLQVISTLVKRDMLGIYYHMISDEVLPHVKYLYRYKSPKQFELDLQYLAKNFNVIGYDMLSDHQKLGSRLKPKSILVTFDDGLAECYSFARPLLLKYGIPCTFFITTDYINNRAMASDLAFSLCIEKITKLPESQVAHILNDIDNNFSIPISDQRTFKEWLTANIENEFVIDFVCNIFEIDLQEFLATQRPYMTLDEIRQLYDDGFTIGAHSTRHKRMNTLTIDEVIDAIITSCTIIHTAMGSKEVPFAFPHSADGVSRQILRDLYERQSLVGLYFDTHGIRRSESYIISRLCGDSTKKSNPHNSNLSFLLKHAYIEELFETLAA